MQNKKVMKRQQYKEVTPFNQLMVIVGFLSYMTVLWFFYEQIPSLWIFWAVLSVVGFIWIVRRSLVDVAFRCPSCFEIFQVTSDENLKGANSWTKKYLTCKNCGKTGWAKFMKLKR